MIESNPIGTRGSRILATSGTGLAVLLGGLLVSGFALETRYRASAEAANASVQAMRAEPFWRWLGDFHYWASGLLIVLSGLHLAAMLWAGRYRSPYTLRWYAALATFLLALTFQITGNLLPFQRHDVQTAVVESGIAAQTPLLGPTISSLMLQGQGFNPGTLTAWHLAHTWILPIASVLVLGLAIGSHRKLRDGRAVAWLAAVPLLLAVLVSLAVSAPNGEPASPADFKGFNATVSWYVWPMHASHIAFQRLNPSLSWIGSALLPGLVVGFLAALPWLPRRVGRGGPRVALLAIGIGFFALGLLFGGPVAPITGPQNPAEIFAGGPGAVAIPLDAAMVERGRELFAANCGGCHGANAKGGTVGPSLADLGLRNPDPLRLTSFIGNPKSVNPRSTMPGFGELGHDKLRALAEFARSPKP